MQTLFEEFEDKNENALKIVAKGPKPLSKNQQLFNKLTKNIETLEIEIIAENEKLSQLLTIHSKEINPLLIKIAHLRIKFAFAIAETVPQNKFTKKQIESIRFVIKDQCDSAFSSIEPTQEQEDFYDKWNEVPYKEEMQQQAGAAKGLFTDYMNDMFGMDVGADEFDNSAEGQARLQAKLHEQFEQWHQEQEQADPKKSKKQQAREKALQEEESIKAKNIRSIYIALAKVLHPDTEVNEFRKAEKEEIMKKVTAAYEQKDLSALLKLEIEWVQKTSEHLEKLTDDKLKIYISALQQQVIELKAEKFNLMYHPRFANIMDYAEYPLKKALYTIRQNKSELKLIFTNLEDIIAFFNWPKTKKQILEFLNSYPRAGDDEDEGDYFDFDSIFEPDNRRY